MIEPSAFTSCYLILTEDCNMKCKYCYENANRCKNNYMSLDTAKKAMDFVLDNAFKQGIERIRLTFFGGEPLLNLDVMIKSFHYAVDKAKQYNISLFFSIITNGTIYNKEFEEFILDWYKATKNVNIQISTDGIPEVQDKSRVNIDGKPISGIILENILKLKKLFEKNKIQSTSLQTHSVITKDTMSSHFLSYKYFKQLGISRPGFKLSNEEDWNENDIPIYIEQLSLISDYVYNECILANSLKPYEEARNIISIKEQEISKIICEAGKTLCAIAPNGDVYPCHRIYFSNNNFKLGNVFNGISDNKSGDAFFNVYRRDMHVDNISCGKCDNAACIVCMAYNYEKYGDILKCNSLVCSMYKAKWKFITEIRKKFEKLSYIFNYNKCNEVTFFESMN
ncbi:MAG: radical SAM protein [Ignavibacteriales bacterium]